VMVQLGQVLTEWRHTAQLYADPGLARELRRPLPGDGDVVPEPVVKEVIGQPR
jgi:hypothetical protein